jgi:hypothetical protein
VAPARGAPAGWTAFAAARRRSKAFRISTATTTGRATAVQISHCTTSSLSVFSSVWKMPRTVDRTSRRRRLGGNALVTARHPRRELEGTAPTGKSLYVDGQLLSHIVDGKFVEEWVHWDTLGLLREIGAVPPPPS